MHDAELLKVKSHHQQARPLLDTLHKWENTWALYQEFEVAEPLTHSLTRCYYHHHHHTSSRIHRSTQFPLQRKHRPTFRWSSWLVLSGHVGSKYGDHVTRCTKHSASRHVGQKIECSGFAQNKWRPAPQGLDFPLVHSRPCHGATLPRRLMSAV